MILADEELDQEANQLPIPALVDLDGGEPKFGQQLTESQKTEVFAET